MARCDHSGSRCNCVVTAGDGAIVTGSGEALNPYRISFEYTADIGGLLAVTDTDSLNLTLLGEGTRNEPYTLSGTVNLPNTLVLALDELTDVDTTGASSGDSLVFNGTEWVAAGEAGGPVPTTLGDLADVTTTGSTTGEILTFDGAGWVAQAPAATVTTLDGLTDVNTTGAVTGDSLVFDGAGWEAAPARNPVTVSATAPLAPQVGDIWFDIS